MGEAGRFLVRQWPDGWVVFDRQSGDTHALAPAAAAVLLSLEKGARDRPPLVQALSPFYPEASQQEMDSRLDDLLEQLTTLGLVEAHTT
jgi:PqqD family protein of HPr-rel-A system